MKALFELNFDGEATGVVHHFCCESCRENWRQTLHISVAEGESNDAIPGTHCANCGLLIQEESSVFRTLLDRAESELERMEATTGVPVDAGLMVEIRRALSTEEAAE